MSNNICWFRVRFGPREPHNVGSISYAALMTSTRYGLPDGAISLHGRVESTDDTDSVRNILRNTADIPHEDAATILIAITRQIEGNEEGEMSAGAPINLIDWLSTLFTTEKATNLARMLNHVAQLDHGASDAKPS